MDGNELQKKIVGILTTQGNVTVSQLAKRLRVRPHSVRYQLDKLVESKSLEKSILVNQRALGYQIFNLFFDLPASRARKGEEFLKNKEEVAWLTKNIGAQKYEMTLAVQDYSTMWKLFRALGDEVGTTPRNVVIAVEGEVMHWGLRCLTETFSSSPIAHFTTVSQNVSIDLLDRRIIHAFGSPNVSSFGSLATKLGVSASTVKYRFERLRADGVISDEGYFFRLPLNLFQAQLVIQLRSRTREIEDGIVSICAKNPNVEGLISGVGNWDFKILIAAESLRELLEVEEALVMALGKRVFKHSMYIREKVIVKRSGV